ncbi:hypothetical protein AVEN_199724-1, partial [Araneus ventricosus]
IDDVPRRRRSAVDEKVIGILGVSEGFLTGVPHHGVLERDGDTLFGETDGRSEDVLHGQLKSLIICEVGVIAANDRAEAIPFGDSTKYAGDC